MEDKIVCYVYSAYLEGNIFEITKHPNIAYKINERKYQLMTYCEEFQLDEEDPEEWIWDINLEDKRNKYVMVDYITLDPNAEQRFKDDLIKSLMNRLLKEKERNEKID